MRRQLAIAAAFLLTATLAFAARVGVVRTIDGRVVEGEIVERDETVLVRFKGIETILPKNEIESIDYRPFEERFRELLAGLDDLDIDGRLQLARYAFDREEYELALVAAQAARDIDVTNAAARSMENTINAQLRLERRRARHAAQDAVARPPRAPETSAVARPAQDVLDLDQVSRIRLLELRPDESGVRISFRNNVKNRFVDSQPGLDFRTFNAMSAARQACEIRDKGDEAMAADVIVMSDPQALDTYVRRINAPLVRGCATSGCHSPTAASSFTLVTVPKRFAQQTNFFLLSEFVRKVDTDQRPFGGSEQLLIDRGRGESSLLAQYLLPRRLAETPHPDVRGFNGLVRDKSDPLFQTIVQWMNRELRGVRPQYGFTFAPPVAKPAVADAPGDEGAATAETAEPPVEPPADSNATTPPADAPAKEASPKS